MKEIYLDNSATTRVFPETADLMHRIYTEEYGNPSSMHHKGVEAERRITEAKQTLADILKVDRKCLYFTSCGSESDNLAIIGCALAAEREGKHLITTAIERPGVLEAMRHLESLGFEVTYLPDAVRSDTVLVSIKHTNNEIGALEPIAEIGEAIKKKNPKTLFHVDAVQGFGKARILPTRMHIDLLAASGHKIHAPKGVGLLYVAPGVKIRNLIYGGGQQGGLRSGTENVAGIAAMALSAKMLYGSLDEDLERLYSLRLGGQCLLDQSPASLGHADRDRHRQGPHHEHDPAEHVGDDDGRGDRCGRRSTERDHSVPKKIHETLSRVRATA